MIHFFHQNSSFQTGINHSPSSKQTRLRKSGFKKRELLCRESSCLEVEVLDSNSAIEEMQEDLPCLKEFPEVLQRNTSDGVISNFFSIGFCSLTSYLLLNVIDRPTTFHRKHDGRIWSETLSRPPTQQAHQADQER